MSNREIYHQPYLTRWSRAGAWGAPTSLPMVLPTGYLPTARTCLETLALPSPRKPRKANVVCVNDRHALLDARGDPVAPHCRGDTGQASSGWGPWW